MTNRRYGRLQICATPFGFRYGTELTAQTAKRRHAECCICCMAMLLVFWVLTSLVLCLAFLGAAARPVPRMDEPMVAGTEAGLQRESGVLLQNPAAA